MSGRSAVLAVACAAALSCANNIGQDAHTGADGKEKGAREIQMDNGEGKAKGIVTYPGGDRVDWKVVDLPKDKRGTLEIKLTWTPPRPCLQLAFDAFDEWNTPVGQTKKASKKKSCGKVRTATIDNAKGKYFIRVYAVGRGDAGAYKLTLEYKENSAIAGVSLDKVDVPDPPKLAEVPAPDATCDEFTFDPKNPACRTICPSTAAPPNWPACKGKCPDPPDVNNSACWSTMACPKPPDRRVRACTPSKFPKCADINNPDPDNPNCDHAVAPPQKGRVLNVSVSGSDSIIEISVGSKQGVGRDWQCHVLRGDGDSAMDNGTVTIVRVDERKTIGKVHLTTDQVNANPNVKCSAPPK